MPTSTATRINDFTIKIATVNGTGSASANTLLMKSIFRSGIPVVGKNYFPSNIQGLPTWYEIRVTRDGYVARSGAVDIMVAMNAETYARDVREVAPGGYLVYDSTWPRPALLKREDITVLGVPLARLCNENFNGVRTRIPMKNICYAGVLAALLGLDLAQIRALLPVRRGDGRRLVPDHPFHLADGRLQDVRRPHARRPAERAAQLRLHPGGGRAGRGRHGDRRDVERCACLYRHIG